MVFIVVVEVIDMDDLDVIRLAVAEIIAKERITREEMDVKEKFDKVTEVSKAGLPDPSTGFSLVRQSSLAGETPAHLKECWNEMFQVALRVALSWSKEWQIQGRSKEFRAPVQEER